MEIPTKGNIKDVSLVRILASLNRDRKTGTLSITTPVFTKKIYIKMGDAIFASSSYEDDRLGEMLLKAGKITVEQYDKSVEILKSTRKRQGAILVELGYLTPKDLFWGVKFQVAEIIHSMFQIEEGIYEFTEGNLPTDEVITLRMSMGNLIYEGVKKIENWTRVRNEMSDTDSILKLSNDPLTLFQQIELSTQDKKILSLIDGSKTIKQIIDRPWISSFEALKILYVLSSIGMVELSPVIQTKETNKMAHPEKEEENVSLDEILQPYSEEEDALSKKIDSVYSKLKNITMSELLETDEDSGSDMIKKNYYRLAKEFHPDRYFTFTDPDIKMKLTTIFDAITNAYNTLKDDKLRAEYFRSLKAPIPPKKSEGSEQTKADEQFKRGIAEFKKGNFWGAIDNFKWATKILPQNAVYWCYLSLAFSKIPGKLKESEDTLLTAIKLEPFNADYHANLGLIYIKAGIKKRAHSSFMKAIKIDPKNEKAQKGLEQTKE